MTPLQEAWEALEDAVKDGSSSVNYYRHHYNKLLKATLKECIERSLNTNDIRLH